MTDRDAGSSPAAASAGPPRGRWRIPLARPHVTDEDVAAVTAVLRSGRLSRGPAEVAFERAVAAACGVGHGVAVASGTLGLQIALRALGSGPGDEVVTTPYSFVASANALLLEGVRPVLADVREHDLNLDPERAEAAITPRTRALLPVHVYGRGAPMRQLRQLARARGLAILEDACEAIGSRVDGRACGSWGRVAVSSFYPNKQVTCGEGGVVLTDDPGLAEHLRRLRNQGRRPGGSALDQRELGFSCRLPEASCALGASQMRRLESIVARRRALAEAYTARLCDSGLVLPPADGPGRRTSWFAYVVRLPGPAAAGGVDLAAAMAARDRVVAALAERGIECGRYFPPIHLQPFYRRRLDYPEGSFPVAEAAGARCIALPFYEGVGEAEIDEVCELLVQAARREGLLRPILSGAPSRPDR